MTGASIARRLGALAFAVSALAASWPVLALELNPSRPDRHVVTSGDTLWGLAERFLRNPWEWPVIWRRNPQVRNPDLIYPGDVIVLDRDGKGPYLRLERKLPYEVLEPEVRITPLKPGIPVIPYRRLDPFLIHPAVLNRGALEDGPYVVALAEEHVLGSPGGLVYVRGMDDSALPDQVVVRPGLIYQDADTGEDLGQEAVYVAEATRVQSGDPATFRLARSEKEARSGDRLIPALPEDISTGFEPHAPGNGLSGHIIGVVDGVSQIGQYSVVALDRGQMDGVERGHVLDIWQKGETLRDISSSGVDEVLTGPEQQAGQLMVVQVFERVSFALVMRAERFVHVQDRVRPPR